MHAFRFYREHSSLHVVGKEPANLNFGLFDLRRAAGGALSLHGSMKVRWLS